MYAITGITGQVGSAVARKLLSENQPVRAVVRNAKPVPMIATADIGRVASELLQQTWSGRRIVEIEGPHRVTPNEIANSFSNLLERSVHAEAVPRESWEALFKAQGTADPQPRIRMLDGFNEGWIEFESGESGSIKCEVKLETVLKSLVERSN